MFDKCCVNMKVINYSLDHSPKPLLLIPELRDSIERMLWYVPGISSYQSYDNSLIDDPLYSMAIFEEILHLTGIKIDSDFKLIEGVNLPLELSQYYNNSICLECQKIIITRLKNFKKTNKPETFIRALLRHIRNSIAHGRFTVVGNLVIFFDHNGKNDTAIIKLDIIKLNSALKRIEELRGTTHENIIARVFENRGFKVVQQKRVGNIIADMIVVKGDRKFIVELKDGNYRPIGYQAESIKKVESMLDFYALEGFTPILIYDKGWLTNKAKEYLKSKSYIVLDKNQLKLFFNELEKFEIF